MRLRGRGLYFSLLLIITVVVMAFIAGNATHSAFKEELNDSWSKQLGFAAEMTASTFENYFEKLSGALLIVAANPKLADMFDDNNTFNEYCPLESVYELYRKNVNVILLLDSTNKVKKRYPCKIGGGRNVFHCPEPVPKHSPDERGIILGDVFINKAGNPAISLSCEIKKDDIHLGYIKWVITIDNLINNLVKENVFSEKTRVSIIDYNSRSLLTTFDDEYTNPEFVYGILKSVEETDDEMRTGFFVSEKEGEKEKVLAAFKRIELYGNKWIVSVSIPYSELSNAIQKNALRTSIIAILSTLLIALIIFNILRLVSQREKALVLANHHREMAKAADKLQNERKMRLKASIDAKETEQKRVSREIHDGLGQILLAMRLKLEEKGNNGRNVKSNQELLEMLDRAVSEVRAISNHLHPPVFSDLGIEKVMEQLCRESEKLTPAKIEFVCYGTENITEALINSYIYRISQEAITNAIKHSKASEINVQLLCTAEHANLIIQDNGVGFGDNGNPKGGNGVVNMKERANLLNGTIKINSNPNTGTIINLRIPINN